MEELNDFALSNAALVLILIIMDFRGLVRRSHTLHTNGEITEISKAVKALTISATNELTRILMANSLF